MDMDATSNAPGIELRRLFPQETCKTLLAIWFGFDFQTSQRYWFFLNQSNNGFVETSMENYAVDKEMVERDKGETKGRSETTES